jgi:hypothetical protein
MDLDRQLVVIGQPAKQGEQVFALSRAERPTDPPLVSHRLGGGRFEELAALCGRADSEALPGSARRRERARDFAAGA